MVYYMVLFWKVLGTGGMVVVPQPYISLQSCQSALTEMMLSFSDIYYVPKGFCVRGEKNV